MRVFYAVTFHKETKERLFEYRNMVVKHSIKGRFTSLNNFHLTLEFIGKVNSKELSLLVDILYKLKHPPKQLIISHIGSFKRKNKEIIWLGIDKNWELIRLQKELRNLLMKNEFEIDNRSYRPHITIGRQIVRKDSIKEIIVNPIQVPIRSIALMESKRVGEKLVYEPLKEIII
ncbi:RNA 2',3'-cyclic phosphodiesterase [Paramaledivibacter caminithermalis]|jgi:2'-5' RNA ligase|uniref:RNA 2',3'-cyclic phosphodiesterase n=1 Tax=Paramaledivibacter caminithermalis (strain DSM 15212 / CIP 107654 / DViRD3) TaxID=1121301 RepID=A0A1M6LYA0_PARC5|nr:RNA 2',3'-cyclic phosphodiesterase [Paramaledivibacter caminithermalis]SHJ76166.1 2'-5' RNA ligase [Paramaledivibacter caminithermalis DSM 15212]